ncbi:MAG: DUF4256 domain-containing protein [Verrucomicrobia bacterium]|nr:DUF4256 domain-containing protein [Verrucomicrobiota bacterium]
MQAKIAENLLEILEARFEANRHRHRDLEWPKVCARIKTDTAALRALQAMESTGGEPDVVGYSKGSGRFTFCDCSAESPSGRRSLCYDPAALESRKEHKPVNSAVGLAVSMGVEFLTVEGYRELQELGDFDTKTSSWLRTPTDIRSLGGALFGDKRYGQVFVYHNGAQSYYAARGFRGTLRV